MAECLVGEASFPSDWGKLPQKKRLLRGRATSFYQNKRPRKLLAFTDVLNICIGAGLIYPAIRDYSVIRRVLLVAGAPNRFRQSEAVSRKLIGRFAEIFDDVRLEPLRGTGAFCGTDGIRRCGRNCRRSCGCQLRRQRK